jgi:hypothetical protein
MDVKKNDTCCSDCDASLNRRGFLAAAGGAALAGGSAALFAVPREAQANPTTNSQAETAVKALYQTLDQSQRSVVCFPFDHQRRKLINPNWKITEPTIGSDFYSDEQRGLIDQVFRGVTSEDGYERFLKQMEEDSGGFGNYTMGIFGQPGSGQFEWEMTGRHLTIRADGDSVDNMAFGGPIVYGHGTGDGVAGLPGNVFYYQLKKANEVFQALDGRQREQALRPKAPQEGRVPIRGEVRRFPGIAVGELSDDQVELVEQTIKTILAPYRKEDVDEAIATLKNGGGLEKLHMAFYRTDATGKPDLGEDGEWEIWRLEGPTFVWHFRGQPHVHAYVNIGKKS